jgi:putrescine aminotransferase
MTTQALQTTELAAKDRRHIVHPHLDPHSSERVIMVAGKGSRVWDSEGREYVDATGGLWVAQVGHGRRELAEVAAQQIERLEYYPSFWEFSTEPAIELAARLVELSPEHLDHVFFTSGGSDCNETAFKMARLYHARRGEPQRTCILSRRNAYHGTTIGAGTFTGFDIFNHGLGPLLPHVHHLTPAWPYRSELFGGDDPTSFLVRELEATIERIGADNIAAFIGEPIMGVAGGVVPPDDYWPRMQEVLRRSGILLILDEVVTGYGRLGQWFAAPHYGLEPDIVSTAKGLTSGYLPLGAVLFPSEIAEAIVENGGFHVGWTYTGHPTACAVGLANLEIIETEGLLGAAETMGASLLEALRDRLSHLPIVGEVRGAGMMLAIELVSDRETREPLPVPTADNLTNVLRREFGVIVRNCGHSIVLSPPFVLTEPEAQRVVDCLGSCLEHEAMSSKETR